jgi:hypothetical protein
MANLMTMPTFFPRRLSQYVPALTYCADVQIGDNGRFSFGSPIVATPAQFLSAQSIAAAGSLQAASLLNAATVDAPYGRNLTFVLSGAGAGTLIVDGWDYLGQAMSESAAYNGATPVAMKKAFKYIRQVTWTLVASTTINVGVGSQLGLPYKAIKVWTEEASGVPVGSVGALTSPDITDPATLSTGDPRGTFLATTTLNGVTVISATFEFANDINAANNGGFHGLAHYTN